MTKQNNPLQLDFIMPAEWEKHSAVWLAWPYDKTTFPERVEKVEQKYAEIIKALSCGEVVKLLVLDEEMKKRAESVLKKAGVEMPQVIFFVTLYADVWIRDYGPTFIKNNKQVASVKWNYNVYGLKFPDLLKDNEVFLNLKDAVGVEMFQPSIFMEGGAIEVNGQGTLITTKQCLLNPNRNPNLNIKQTEEYLKSNLGVNNIVWLEEGLINDHTDGHVDDIVKFVNEDTILCAYEDNPSDENFVILDNNYKVLEKSLDQNGKSFNLVKLPMPHMNYADGTKAPVSYANFYIGNKVVLVPTYNDPSDATALQIISSYFKDRKTIGIDCRDIIYGGGAIHCITQQQPL